MAEPTRSPSILELIATGRWKFVRETYPLPSSRAEIIKKIEEILAGGRVQKLVVQVSEPIRVERIVPKKADEVFDPAELPEDDYAAAVRNSELQDLDVPDGTDPLEAIRRAFVVLRKKDAKATAVLARSPVLVADWIGSEEAADELFGVRVRYSLEVPEDVVILCGTTDPDDPFSIVTHSVRLLAVTRKS